MIKFYHNFRSSYIRNNDNLSKFRIETSNGANRIFKSIRTASKPRLVCITPNPERNCTIELHEYENFEDLKYLVCPPGALKDIAKWTMPKIMGLRLGETSDLDRPTKWPKELVLNSLVNLTIPYLEHTFHHNPECTPNLQRFELSFMQDKKGDTLSPFLELPHIKHASFDHTKSFDVFKPFRDKKLESIELSGSTGKNVPIQSLYEVSTLKYLNLGALTSVELDCKDLAHLTDLEEVYLNTCRKIANVNALLQLPKLKRLEICDCKNETLGIDTASFLKHDFEYLQFNEKTLIDKDGIYPISKP